MKKKIKTNSDIQKYKNLLNQTAITCKNYREMYELDEIAMEKKLNDSIQKQTKTSRSSILILYRIKNRKKT